MGSLLSNTDYLDIANMLGVEVACIKAVFEVECPKSGFADNGFPTILFEAHLFSKFTNHIYDASNPDISSRVWNKALYTKSQETEQARLSKARKLDNISALKSASYGKPQILGSNFKECGCTDVQDFINKMCKSEKDQLILFAKFLKNTGVVQYLKTKNWAGFAEKYNGPGYKANNYDVKLAKAYKKFTG